VVDTNRVARRWYVLIVLTLVYALSIADRYVMSTLIEPIKADLNVSDSAIGFLTGVSLALFYVTAGLPLASLVVPWFVAGVITLATVPSIIAYTAASSALAIKMLWIFVPLSYAPFGPTFALLQNLVPASMRAQTVALMLFFSNVANLVIAPQAVGFASDYLAPVYGTESLRHALVPLAFVGFWAALHYWLSAKYLERGLRQAGNVSIVATAL
jgi:hypothetical protein